MHIVELPYGGDYDDYFDAEGELQFGPKAPAWIECFMECGDDICTLHRCHTFEPDCKCPPFEIWELAEIDPYAPYSAGAWRQFREARQIARREFIARRKAQKGT